MERMGGLTFCSTSLPPTSDRKARMESFNGEEFSNLGSRALGPVGTRRIVSRQPLVPSLANRDVVPAAPITGVVLAHHCAVGADGETDEATTPKAPAPTACSPRFASPVTAVASPRAPRSTNVATPRASRASGYRRKESDQHDGYNQRCEKYEKLRFHHHALQRCRTKKILANHGPYRWRCIGSICRCSVCEFFICNFLPKPF